MKKNLLILFGFIFIICYGGCAEIGELLQTGIKKPTAGLSKVSLSGLSFKQADLLFDMRISNPNTIGITLAALDYDLILNNVSFLKGQQEKNLSITANGSSVVQLPLSLNFANIYNTYQNLKNADSVAYTINAGLSFNLPVIGPVRIPVSKSSSIPNLKLPKISLHSLKLDNLSFTGAKLNMKVKVDNPNIWSVILNKLDYSLNINGQQWIQGITDKPLNINGKKNNVITIPIALNFLQIGSSVYNIISGGKGLNYSLEGSADLGSSLELLGNFNLPFSKEGKIDLLK